MTTDHGLNINNLSMRFDLPNGGSVQALKNVNLHLKSGELMSVLGPSGCGKTTLLNIIAGFWRRRRGNPTEWINRHRPKRRTRHGVPTRRIIRMDERA